VGGAELNLAVDLTAALGAALAPPLPQQRTTLKAVTLKAAAPAPPPVFQMAALPTIVEPATYADAHSNTNPNGSYLSLRALRDLVDPVPLFSRTYQAGPSSTERLWGLLVNSASAATAFANSLLGDARSSWADTALSGLDGLPGTWRPVYAAPSSWTNLADDTAFRTVTVDLTGTADGPTTTRLSTIGGDGVAMQWTTVDATGATTTTPISGGTSLDSIVLDIRQVTLQRPWLDISLLTAAGIDLAGQDPGYVSSGDVHDNDGVLPLLPAAFWLARSARLRATLAPADRDVLAQADDDTHVSLGGIAIAGPAAESAPPTGQVIAWTSTLVPCWPR
jgi:hypothetical protein